MVTRVVTHNDVTDACGLAELVPYPAVAQGTNTTVTSAVGADGKTTYTVAVSNADIVNAVEAGIATDTGAQQAIANAIADNLSSSAGFAASVKAAETKTTLVLSGGNYVYTNEANVQTVIQPANFLSTNAGQSLSTGTDGKLYVNVIGILPSDSTYSGSTLGNVNISIVGDGGSPEQFTIEGNLDVAAQTPTNGTNLLKSSASGFYVSGREIAADIASDPTALSTLSSAIAGNAASTAALLAALGDPFGL
jgi:hypothetical protein